MNFTKMFFISVLSLGLHACATVDAARQERGSGLVKTYPESFEKTWAASLDAVESTGGRIVEKNPQDGDIIASYGVSAFSWGERLAIFLKSIGSKKTEVEVVSKRAVGVNVTATDWAPKIHQEIEEALASK